MITREECFLCTAVQLHTEFTVVTTACTKSLLAPVRQESSMERKRGYEISPLLIQISEINSNWKRETLKGEALHPVYMGSINST